MTIAIIGAGPSGLAAAKAALECGLIPTVLEKSNQVGGLWKSNDGAVWDSMRTNLSYHSCSFSDFPWENPSNNFPTQQEVCGYLNQYAAVNGLNPHIQFETQVHKVRHKKDMWKVEYVHNGRTTKKQFDFVIIASGIFSKAYIPNIKGLDTFTGKVLHSHDYKNPSQFKDKVVAVIGNSFSGTEIAAEISTLAKHTIHIASQAMWVLPRELPIGECTRALDLVFYSRESSDKSRLLQPAEKNTKTFQWFTSLTKQHEVAPELAVVSDPSEPSYVAISDTYIPQVKASKIELVRDRIEALKDRVVICKEGQNFNVDAVVFATGYECTLEFFDKPTLEILDYKPEDHFQPLLLDKCVFHPQLPNIAFVGMYRGPYFTTMELQARLACHVFAKIVGPISQETMIAGVESERKIRNQVPRPQFPHGNYVEYADSLASLAGVLPNLDAIKISDEALHQKLYKGPLIAAHYRLEGHAKNPKVASLLINAANK